MNYSVFTSESVCAGHPDKICDQISDAIVDAALRHDPQSRVAVETLVTKNQAVLAGEVTSKESLRYEAIARTVIHKLGYTNGIHRFHYAHSPISVFIHEQAPDIAQGVDEGGAGDQGIMYGYACRETPELMPLPIMIAHRLAQRIDQLRATGILPYLRPDGKTEVSVRYEHGRPVAVERLIIAVPHNSQVQPVQVKQDLYRRAVKPILEQYNLTYPLSKLVLNGTGKWEVGGPASDTGVTGRKIIVDTYGGMGRHGGGCFSGKDPTKVDRSGAYACRYLAKNIVAAGLADRVEVKVAYVIGQKEPIARAIDAFGTAKKSAKLIRDFADRVLDLSVPNILEKLDLRRPIYLETAAYGHFGRDGFPWEEIIG
jgi:S-adenosylmethionine synthetase